MSQSDSPQQSIFDQAVLLFRQLQKQIIGRLEALERDVAAGSGGNQAQAAPAVFFADAWEKPEDPNALRGGGLTCVLEGGRVFERAGVNFSDVFGTFSDEMAGSMPGKAREFRASGISLVIHPRNPQVPTVHANFRVIRRGPSESPDRVWFGGGADLTPYVLYDEDAVSFHTVWKSVCESHAGVADYDKMKRACDEYFFLPHRAEARGVGGIFFDYVDATGDSLAFVRDAGSAFLSAYVPIVERRAPLNFSEREREFQLLRRGRYVEFNLVYDRGTHFGLRTGGRIESILMSMPPLVRWEYSGNAGSTATPSADSEQLKLAEHLRSGSAVRESALLDVLRNPRDWV